eukprot:jgi/Botrbrau1/18071/Bobra.0062s0057.1
MDSSYYTTYVKHSEGASPMRLLMKGKNIVLSDETEEEFKFVTKIVKRDTGGVYVKARALFSNTVFQPTLKHTPIVSTNHDIRMTSIDDGIMKRLVQFTFLLREAERRGFRPLEPAA